MSTTSPDIQASSSTDPFQLDRLAEELVRKELSQPKAYDEGDHDLPIYVPLSHDNTYLSAANFDVEEFLLSRSHTSLQDLRIELRDYLSALKEELVKLINDDYEAFISLSTDLKGEGARLNKLKAPLSNLKSQILVSKAELCTVQDEIKDKLEKRAILREEKALLHLLLRISESVARLESLLLIVSPNQDANDQVDLERFRLPSNLNPSDNALDERSRANRAKHLSRVAAEYTQLLYHASKARGEKCAFVNEIQWRIDRIQSTLSSDLDLLFASTLTSLTGRGSELEKSKLIADLTECLRTYDVLGLWRDAEDILRKEVVRGFIKKTIFPGALAAPHSPLLPHTPFRSSTTPAFLSSSSALPPRTPYTPYTAFSIQQGVFQTSTSTDLASPYARLLDDNEEPLAKLYTQILRFVERDLSRVMDIADKVSIKSHTTGKGLPDAGLSEIPGDAGDQGFDIMANVIWAELGRAIMDDLGNVVFAAGRPNEFKKNYEITQVFIRSLEFLAPSVHPIEHMRSHPVYAAFEKRWQLPVYFQMRWKEIVAKVEEALAVPHSDEIPKSGSNTFMTSQANAIWIGLTACWSAEVYIPQLSYRFLRLTLQLLSRYRTWVDQMVLDHNSSPQPVTATGGNDKALGSSTRSSTPVPSDNSSAEIFAADEVLLRKYVAVIADIKTMRSSVMTLWTEEISIMLPDTQESDIEDPQTEEVLQKALLSLSSLTTSMSETISSILTKRCNDALLPVRSIPSQFRAMSNKRPPTEPSPFVPSILRPIKVFFGIGIADGVGTPLKDDFLLSISSGVFENVCQRYVYYIAAMKKTEESLRRLKKGKKNTFSLFGNAAKEDEGRDEERIRTQMILDVEAFRKDAESFGVQPGKSDSFKSLDDLVRAIDPPETS